MTRLYERWQGNTYSQTHGLEHHTKKEFSNDDYIQLRANEAECLLNCGKVFDAIEKFEKVKKDINQEVVFDQPLLYINVCNQLGNCYLRVDDQNKALDNFESSLCLINKGGDGLVSDHIIAKICSNIALISG